MTDAEKIAALETENEQLKKSNEIKSNWISISAHQLRTSLSAVKWILKMFLDGDFGALSGDQQSFMQKAYDNNDRMVSMVTEMLTLNHTDSTDLTFSFSPRNIVDLIEQTLFDFTSESYKKGIQLLFAKPTVPLPLVPMDLEKIRVVLQNLIENAIKYCNTGDKLLINAVLKETEIEVSVKDTGIGIPTEEQPKIFTKFFRAENARAKDSIGSGLGLYTSKLIVERHGGKIWFESKQNGGTTFFFTLPLHK